MGLAVAALLAVTIAPAASATTYTVSTNPYSANRTLSASEAWDGHELVAQNGQSVQYSVTVTTTGACLRLFFIKGHNVNPNSQYYIAYSQENCVQNYGNTFPVASSDGTDFTVLLDTTGSGDVAYSVSISITTPAIPSWVLGLLVLIGIIVLGIVVRVVIRRARRPKPMPPMAPPSYPGPGAPGAPMPPQQYPPQEPPYGPPPPPP